jgi:hypothetical protein
VILAFTAYAIFLRNYAREEVPDLDRQVAPALALCILGLVSVVLAAYWIIYRMSGETRFDFGP